MTKLYRALLVVYGAAALIAAFWYAIYLGNFVGCGEGRDAEAAKLEGYTPSVSASFARARPDEAIFLCRHTHCPEVPTPGGHVFLPVMCHQDLGCFCAPRASSIETVGKRLLGDGPGEAKCNLEAALPSEDDDTTACPRARCLRHLEP
jgi:hypothetical protein